MRILTPLPYLFRLDSRYEPDRQLLSQGAQKLHPPEYTNKDIV